MIHFQLRRRGRYVAMLRVAAALFAVALVPRVGSAQTASVDSSWRAAPTGFPAGSEMQAFVGNPSAAGFYAVRIRVPDGELVGPLAFPREVRVVLIRGAFSLGRGIEPKRRRTSSLDPSERATSVKAGVVIHGWGGEGAVIQFEGEGPFAPLPVEPRPSP